LFLLAFASGCNYRWLFFSSFRTHPPALPKNRDRLSLNKEGESSLLTYESIF
jgi:hypothetical protein